MAEVERVINDRPIAPLSDDPNDQRALSPNFILLGSLETDHLFDVFCKADGYKKAWRAVQFLSDVLLCCETLDQRISTVIAIAQKMVGAYSKLQSWRCCSHEVENCRRGLWRKGVITENFPDQYGHARRVCVSSYSDLNPDQRRSQTLLAGGCLKACVQLYISMYQL